MNAVIKNQSLEQYMQQLGAQAKAAAAQLAVADPASKNKALLAIADELIEQREALKVANE